MEFLNGPMIYVLIAVVGLIAIGGFFLSRLKIAGPNEAFIISGSRDNGEVKIIPPGGKAFVIPIIQESESMSLQSYQIGVTTECVDANMIPIEIEGVAMVKVGSAESSIRSAAERFAGREDEIRSSVTEVLRGTLRSTAGKLTVSDLISDRDAFSADVNESAQSGLERMGIVIDTFQIQDIRDGNGYIRALGEPEAQIVAKKARVAKAQNEAEANQAEAESQRKIAEQNRDLEVYQAEMAKSTMEARAVAEAAGPIAEAEQQKEITLREQEVAKQRAVLREQQLESEVRKPADAERYRMETEAIALRKVAEMEAEAEALTIRKKGEADAEANRAVGLAKAEADKAIGLAEAEATDAKAEALAKYNDAAINIEYIKVLPQIVEALSGAYDGVDMTIISNDGATAPTKAVLDNVPQIQESLKAMGIDVDGLMGRITGSNPSKTIEE